MEEKREQKMRYEVANVTFCSDKEKYPLNTESAEVVLNHLRSKGTVTINPDCSIDVDLEIEQPLTELQETLPCRRKRPGRKVTIGDLVETGGYVFQPTVDGGLVIQKRFNEYSVFDCGCGHPSFEFLGYNFRTPVMYTVHTRKKKGE